MRLNQKQEEGLETAYDILCDIAKALPYESELERMNLACDTLHEILASSRKQKARDRCKRALKKGRDKTCL